MAKRQSKRGDPFDVRLDADQLHEVTTWLVEEIRKGMVSRLAYQQDNGLVDWAYSLYEQQSQKGISRDTHRYGSADLTSPIGTEHVDTLSARTAKTIFTAPLWVVEGDGPSESKAPTVELYMQMRQEQMRLQKTLRKVVTASYVETGSIAEVCEDVVPIIVHEQVRAKIATGQDGNRLIGEDGAPVAARDERGRVVEADDTEEYVDVKVARPDYRRRGATVRRRSTKDFLFLPAHAEDEIEVWGHATRYWARVTDLKAAEAEGKFEHIDLLATAQEREQRAEHDRAGVSVEQPVTAEQAEKELWRVQFWANLDGQGECLYEAHVSEIHSTVIRLKYDWLGRWRTAYCNPYPCPYAVWGYSMILTKLLTTIEEHTAWRNMNADRATLKNNVPMMRLVGALWDPSVQPMGAGQIIDVNDMNELQPMPFEDVTSASLQKEQQCVADGQRIIGLNDLAIGQQSEKSRTLGENKMATQSSFLRTDDPIGNIQEFLEELGAIIHAIEVQALRDREDEGGVTLPSTMASRLQGSVDGFDGTITADMIAGSFTFRPRGSVQDADPERRIQKHERMFGTAMQWAKVNQSVAQRMASEDMGNAIMQVLVDDFQPRDEAPFLKPMAQPQMPGMGGPPGMPPMPGPQAPPFASGGDAGGDPLMALLAGAGGGVQ